MSLHAVAQNLAAQGRGPDTTLVHMTPGEVRGLQALARAHGTSLTTNPQTGLPEAGVLSNILPALAGTALSFFSGGTLTPMMAGALVGGGTALATGSLQKGLAAGLGAWGGAGLGGGLASLGQAAASGATNPSSAMAVNGMDFASDAASKAAAGAAQPAAAAPGGFSMGIFSTQNLANSWDAAKSGMSRIMDPGGVQDFVSELGGGKNALMYGGAALAPVFMATGKGGQPPNTDSTEGRQDYQFDYGRKDPEEGYSGPYTGERTHFRPAYRRMADGGPVSIDPKAPVKDNPYYTMTGQSGDAFKYLMGQGKLAPPPAAAPVAAPAAPAAGAGGPGAPSYSFDPGTGMFTSSGGGSPLSFVDMMRGPYDWWGNAGPGVGSTDGQGGAVGGSNGDGGPAGAGFADGGLAALAGGGRFLKGPGDGISDSIPASINGQQPAALANEEYVIPARVVSALGNGSSSAGAKRLDQLVNRVMRADSTANSRKSVAKNINPDRLLPA
jgi:hypothetical protein